MRKILFKIFYRLTRFFNILAYGTSPSLYFRRTTMTDDLCINEYARLRIEHVYDILVKAVEEGNYEFDIYEAIGYLGGVLYE